MAKIKYDADVMQYVSLFESLTGAKIKDCILNDNLLFIINEGDMGKAIGRKGANVKRLERVIKKKIRVVEFNKNITDFVKNLLYPITAKKISEAGSIVTIEGNDTKTRGIIIGRNRHNIERIKGIAKRHFTIEDIKVV